MNRILFTFFSLFASLLPQAAVAESDNATFTLEMATRCILLNKDLSLASSQLLNTENKKAEITSKIRYLERVIEERRALIEELDQVSTYQNNDNYNQLVEQFENLTEEKRETLKGYNKQHQLHVIQHESVIRLEQRFNKQCLNNISLPEDIYQQACESETATVRWCQAFSFE